jgi:uncharacterized repeat protein (TIGR03843 family)
MKSVLEHLTQGELEVTGRLVDASNATLYAQCTLDDQVMAVIYKPVAGERPLWDFPDGNLAQREYAAYVISEMGNFRVVPPTVLREGPFGVGMVQQWIDIDESVDLAEFYRTDSPELRKMALFDAVINNTDRKIGHLLPISADEVLGCDHGVTFHEEDKLRTVLWQWADQPLSLEEIAQLTALEFVIKNSNDELLALITETELKALLARINTLIHEGTFPSPSDEWPAVPWPPF